MTVVLVYSPSERGLVQGVAGELEKLGCEMVMAPMGLEAMSPDWVRQSRADIERASTVLVLLTEASVADPSVAARCEWAMAWNLKICPIVPEGAAIPAVNTWAIPRVLGNYNWVQLGANAKETASLLFRGFLATHTPKKCFISYSRADKVFVERLQRALHDHDIQTWRDMSDIGAGANWDNEIEAALTRCSCVLFVASQSSLKSANVADEIGFARTQDRRIIPFMIEDVQLPMRVHRAQAIDFRQIFEEAVQLLVAEVKG